MENTEQSKDITSIDQPEQRLRERIVSLLITHRLYKAVDLIEESKIVLRWIQGSQNDQML